MPIFHRTLLSLFIGAALPGAALARSDLPNYTAQARYTVGSALTQSEARPLRRDDSDPAAATRQRALRQQLISSAEAISVDQTTGMPSFIWAHPALPQAGVMALKPEAQATQAAQSYLRRYAPLYGLDSATLSGAVLQRLHDTGQGAIIAQYGQQLDGIEVFGATLNIAMKRDLRLLALSGSLSPQLAGVTKRRTRARSQQLPVAEFKLSPQAAIVAAFADMGGQLPASSLKAGERHGAYQTFTVDDVAARGEYRLTLAPRAKKVWFTLGGTLEPAYYLELSAGPAGSTDADSYGYVISAVSGKVLLRNNHTAADAFNYRVYADNSGINLPWDGPQGRYGSPNPYGAPFPLPPASELFKAANLVSLEHGPISTGDPWLAPGATDTQGNNVDSYVDDRAPSGFGDGDFRAQITSFNSFDYPLDPTLPANDTETQRKAAVVQMFYLNNWMHDWFYDAGFDEAAGNAQADNYGRGGLGNDRLLSEAQDYSGFNNANMSTPADGRSPRMQMYLFTQNGDAEAKLGAAAYPGTPASFGPGRYHVQGELVRYADASGSDLACAAPVDAAALAGKIALISRGNCPFTQKVKNAQDAGAIAALVYNHVADGSAASMGGSDNTVSIPSQGFNHEHGQAMLAALAEGPQTVQLAMKPSRDSSMDALIMAHEWGHYISNRLIGNGNGLNNNQGGSMGEGWGDFHALLMTVEKDDLNVANNLNFGGSYAMGGYAGINTRSTEPAGTFYWGIRRVPYSTDLSKNALTFKHIELNVPLPAGVPVRYGADGSSNNEVHAAGEVWATMLWECYAALLNDPRNSFEQAQDKMKRYLVAGYKLTPSSPTYVEARDALLVAARASDESDFQLFANAFAKRGMGAGAVAPDRFDTEHRGVVESFSTGAGISVSAAALDTRYSRPGEGGQPATPLYCDDDGVLDAGETAKITVHVRNSGFSPLKNLSAQLSSLNNVTFGNGGHISFPDLAPLQSASAEVEVTLNSASTREALKLDIAYSSPDAAAVGQTLATEVNFDRQAAYTRDDGNKALSDWRMETLSGEGLAFLLKNNLLPGQNPHDFIYHGINNGTAADIVMVSPELVVSAEDGLKIRWQQAFGFEVSDNTNWDGAVVEYSTDDGGTWEDAGNALSPAYNGTVQGDNPLKGRQAYVGRSASFPGMSGALLDLSGRGLADQSVRIRLRIASDSNTGGEGWLVDDIDVQGVTNLPFTKVMEDRKQCVAQLVTARAGVDQRVRGVTRVTLDGSASSGTQAGEALNYQWTQIGSAAPVALSDANSAMPTFTTRGIDETLRFRLTVSNADGKQSSDEVVVKVSQRHAPIASAGPDQHVLARAATTLNGTGSSHPDGEALNYQWRQLSGTPVTLSNADQASATFTAPANRSVLLFELTVSDAFGGIKKDEVRVFVRSAVLTPQ